MRLIEASVILPCRNEDQNIIRTLEMLKRINNLSFETIVVVDSKEDSTIKAIKLLKIRLPKLKVLVQPYGAGAANAIRYGIERSNSDCVVVMMADGSDDTRSIIDLVNLVNRGVVVACASRYMSGGMQIGGPKFKKFLSKTAGKILYMFAGVRTHDPTNSFKAYSKQFINKVGIQSNSGFEIGIELVAKAHRYRLPIAEIPTI